MIYRIGKIILDFAQHLGTNWLAALAARQTAICSKNKLPKMVAPSGRLVYNYGVILRALTRFMED